MPGAVTFPVNKVNTLFIVNKALPVNDYRLDYGVRSEVCRVIYGLPERSSSLPEEDYLHLGFEEGLHLGVLKALWNLLVFLRKSGRSLAFVHFFTTNPILFGPVVSRITGTRAVITFTGFGRVMSSTERKYRFVRPVYRILLRHSLRTAKLVLFQNRADHELL
jgi:hypothetical protein